MSNIYPFPSHNPQSSNQSCDVDTGKHAATKLPTTSGNRCEYAIGDLARFLGLSHRGQRTIIHTLRTLAKQEAMPLPKTPRIHGGKIISGHASIGYHSRWDTEIFDGWLFERDSGPDDIPAAPMLRQNLAHRAAMMATGTA